MDIQIGNINKLKVLKETDIAYTLTTLDGEGEFFLHFNQATRRLKEKEIVEVFLYYDNKKRLCATMETPLVTTLKYGFCEVVNVINGTGCFMNINISKDILLSSDYLPSVLPGWPKLGEKLPIILIEKRNTLTAKLLTREDLSSPHKLNVGDNTLATITGFTKTGIICITNDYDFIYIHKSMVRKKYHVGEIIEPKIININNYNEYNGSLIENKEIEISSDKELIMKYLTSCGGVAHIGDKSTPEEISKVFMLSKSAFKRAIGSLYKDGLIELYDNKIILK